LRGVSKDGRGAIVAHPSRVAVKNGEHLRMTAVVVRALDWRNSYIFRV
jgi:hypothetical protein